VVERVPFDQTVPLDSCDPYRRSEPERRTHEWRQRTHATVRVCGIVGTGPEVRTAKCGTVTLVWKSPLPHYEISQVAKGVEFQVLSGTSTELNRSPDGPAPSIFPVAEEVRGGTGVF
jgi:hypothetical protein